LLAGIDRESDGGDHERHSRPGRGFRQCAGRAARAKCRLAALSAKRRGNVPALAALQQHDNDDEKTDQDVDRRYQVNHRLEFFLSPSVAF